VAPLRASEAEHPIERPTRKKQLDVLEKTRLVVDAAQDVKAEDIAALDVRALSSFSDVFVVATGRSDRQVRAIADSIEAAAKKAGAAPLGIEGYAEGRWVLIDLDDVIVHIFVPEARSHYDIERLWSDAEEIPIPNPSQAEGVR
jgi:ribosome-associated protein